MAFEAALDGVAAALGTDRTAAGYLLGTILIVILIVVIVLVIRDAFLASMVGLGVGATLNVLFAWWPPWTIITLVTIILILVVKPWEE